MNVMCFFFFPFFFFFVREKFLNFEKLMQVLANSLRFQEFGTQSFYTQFNFIFLLINILGSFTNSLDGHRVHRQEHAYH